MTESEAKKYMVIEKECINRDCNRDCANCDIVQNVEDLNNAYDVAINALEKQIPKKPDCIEDKMWCCPVCDNNLLHKWIKYPTKLMPKSEGLPHCMSCGQAIDWSDEK